jgi:hypothetical protein
MARAAIWTSIVMAAALTPAANGRPAGIVVGPGQSVQAAIDGAPQGAEITLPAGTFSESVTITKPLTLRGAGWEKTTIGPDRAMALTQKQKDEFFAALEATTNPRERTRIAVELATRQMPPTLIVKNSKDVILSGIRFRGHWIAGTGDSVTAESLVTFDNAAGSIVDCAVIGP